MGWQTVKQPDGLYAVWSTIVDDFIAVGGTREEIQSLYLEAAEKRINEQILRDLANGKSYDEFIDWRKIFVAAQEAEEE